jgi:hypothetical protein
LKRIVLVKIVYSDGSSLSLKGEDAAWLVRNIDSLIARAIRAEVQHGQRVGSDGVQEGPVSRGTVPGRVPEQQPALPPGEGPDEA